MKRACRGTLDSCWLPRQGCHQETSAWIFRARTEGVAGCRCSASRLTVGPPDPWGPTRDRGRMAHHTRGKAGVRVGNLAPRGRCGRECESHAGDGRCQAGMLVCGRAGTASHVNVCLCVWGGRGHTHRALQCYDMWRSDLSLSLPIERAAGERLRGRTTYCPNLTSCFFCFFTHARAACVSSSVNFRCRYWARACRSSRAAR